jgi:AcrR family transcriptional regulator
MAETKDSEERRNEFVDAAEKLFKENGIVDTTINSIVKEMNVAKGLFYYYFKSKDDVIDAISDKYNEVFNEMMHASMDKPTYEERLEQYVENCVSSFRTLTSEVHGDVDLTQLSLKSIDEAKQSAINGLSEMFEEGMNNGALQFVHPKYYADILVSGILTLVEEKEATDEEIKNIIMDLIKRSGKE